MTSSVTNDRSHESIINDALARLLRERAGLSAAAETLHGGRRPDILVRLAEGPIILEIEIAPAPTVVADALSRLGMEIDGSRVQNAFTGGCTGKRARDTTTSAPRKAGRSQPGVARMENRRHIRPQARRQGGGTRRSRGPYDTTRRQPGSGGGSPGPRSAPSGIAFVSISGDFDSRGDSIRRRPQR